MTNDAALDVSGIHSYDGSLADDDLVWDADAPRPKRKKRFSRPLVDPL